MSNTNILRRFADGTPLCLLMLSVSVQAAPEKVELITVDSTGAAVGGFAAQEALSSDGRYVLYKLNSTGVPSHDNPLYLRDRVTGRSVRVDLNSAGQPGNDWSGSAVLSEDGRFVAFISDATNLVAGDTNGTTDIFLRDLQAGTTTRVSVSSKGAASDGYSYYPTISGDGRYVAFWSSSSTFVENVQRGLYVHDRVTRQTRWLRGSAYGSCTDPQISANGAYVAFQCRWQPEEWWPGYGNNAFLYELATDRVFPVMVGRGYANEYTDVSADGRYVSFYSQDAYVTDDNNRFYDVYVWDRLLDRYQRVSVASNGHPGNLHSHLGEMSGDARYVAFYSTASNLVPDDPNRRGLDMFIRDRRLHTTRRVSVEAETEWGALQLSADGRTLLFSTPNRLVPEDTNDEPDVYVRMLPNEAAVEGDSE